MIYDTIILALLALGAQAVPFPKLLQGRDTAMCMKSWNGEFGFMTTTGGSGKPP